MVDVGTLPRVTGLGRTVRVPSRALFELVGEPVPPIVALGQPVPIQTARPATRPTATISAPVRTTPPPSRRIRPRAPARAKEATVEAPIRAGDQRLWLLADAAQYRLMTWHIGDTAALCGKAPAGKWKRSRERYPAAVLCTTCLTLVSQQPSVDLASVPMHRVAMLRQTQRGTTATVIRAGWHLGDGRVTKCGKRTGPWALTERHPDRRKVCFECGERDQWEMEKVPDSVAAMEAGGSWSVLVDAHVGAHQIESFIQGAPGLFAARRARRAIDAADTESNARGLHELFREGESISQGRRYQERDAPSIVVIDDPAVLDGEPGRWWGLAMTPAVFMERMAPSVAHYTKAKVLRDRWDREAKAVTPRRRS